MSDYFHILIYDYILMFLIQLWNVPLSAPSLLQVFLLFCVGGFATIIIVFYICGSLGQGTMAPRK